MISSGKLIFLLFASLCLGGCVSHKNLLNLQGNEKNTSINHLRSAYLVQSGDILDVRVSSVDPQSVAIFNKESASPSNQVSPASIYLNGYSINDSGFVNLPLIGELQVKGLTINQVKDSIDKMMKPYYKYVSVDVKLMSFQVTVLGEVNAQGTFNIYRDQANIIQAIGLAGGVTDFADRKKVRVIRKTNDISELAYLDISSSEIIASPYYYLQPNDIIYIEPLKAKITRLNAPAIQIALSTLTFIIVMLNFATRF